MFFWPSLLTTAAHSSNSHLCVLPTVTQMDHSRKRRKGRQCKHRDQCAAHQDGAAGGGLQAGQASGQQSSVAALGIVLQSDAVRLGVLHDQTRVLGLRQAGVQFTSTGIHEVELRTMSGDVVNYPSSDETVGPGRGALSPTTSPVLAR